MFIGVRTEVKVGRKKRSASTAEEHEKSPIAPIGSLELQPPHRNKSDWSLPTCWTEKKSVHAPSKFPFWRSPPLFKCLLWALHQMDMYLNKSKRFKKRSIWRVGLRKTWPMAKSSTWALVHRSLGEIFPPPPLPSCDCSGSDSFPNSLLLLLLRRRRHPKVMSRLPP